MPLTPQQEKYLGILHSIKTNVRTPNLDLFKKTIAPTNLTSISWDDVADGNFFADVVARGTTGKPLVMGGFDRYKFTPDLIDTEVHITPEEISQMQAGQTVYLEGTVSNTGDVILKRKMAVAKNAILRRQDDLCAKILKTGSYTLKNGDTLNFGLKEAVGMNYNATTTFIKGIYNNILAFRKLNYKNPDKIRIGEKIIEKLLDDKTFQEFVKNMGLAGMQNDNQELVVAQVLNQQLNLLDPTIGDTGTEIFDGTEIHMLNQENLYKAYSGVPVANGDKVENIATDIFADVITEKRAAKQIVYATSGFSPVVANPNSIYRIDVAMS